MSDIFSPYRPKRTVFVSPVAFAVINRHSPDAVMHEGNTCLVSDDGIWIVQPDPDCPDDYCWPTPQNLPRDIGIAVSNVILALSLVRAFRALVKP